MVFLSLIVVAIFLTASSPAWPQGKPEKERIRFGYAARAAAHSFPYIIKEVGFFNHEGLEVEVVRTAGSVAPMAMISGDVDYSMMSAFLLIPASIKHGDIVMLGALQRYATMFLVARPEIRTAEDLRGKVLGLQRPGDAYEFNARFALRHLRLDSKDVKFLYLGSNEVMWTALEAGRVAATMLTPPATLFARNAGMNFLVSLSDLKVEYQGSTFATRRSFIRAHPNLTGRVLRALVRGIYFFKTQREDTLRILAKFLQTSDREALEETWKHQAADLPAKPYASESAVQAVLNHMAQREPSYKQHRPSEFIESGPLRELDRSGYMDQLYRGSR